MLQLDLVQTLAFAGLALFIGYGFRCAVPPLGRYNLPAPVIGGLLVVLAMSICRNWGVKPITFDDTFQKPLMKAHSSHPSASASVWGFCGEAAARC